MSLRPNGTPCQLCSQALRVYWLLDNLGYACMPGSSHENTTQLIVSFLLLAQEPLTHWSGIPSPWHCNRKDYGQDMVKPLRPGEVAWPQHAACKQTYVVQEYLIAKRLHGLGISPTKQAATYIAYNACQHNFANSHLNIYTYADKS